MNIHNVHSSVKHLKGKMEKSLLVIGPILKLILPLNLLPFWNYGIKFIKCF